MDIYFCGAIRGGRDDVELYAGLVKHLQNYGTVLSAHVGDKGIAVFGEDGISDKNIHNRDLTWLLQAGVVVAEVSTPSLGVGYELGRRVERIEQLQSHSSSGQILCLYRPQEGRMLSAMIRGSRSLIVKNYATLEDACQHIDTFFAQLKK